MNLVLCQSAQGTKQIKRFFPEVNSFCTVSSSCPDQKAFLTSKVLIFLVQVKLDGILRPGQSLPFLNSMKTYKRPLLKFKITL